MRSIVVLLLAVAAVSALPDSHNRIVGGSITTINQYPEIATILHGPQGFFFQWCGGVILNNRSILTAAHCYYNRLTLNQWRIRLGSTNASSGGSVFNVVQLILHNQYNDISADNDIGVMRVANAITTTNVIRPASIGTYLVPDNAVVWAAGWGAIWEDGPGSEQLRHVQIYTINQAVCRQRYAAIAWFRPITDNMMCSGILNVGGRDACSGDSGGPVYHNGVVVGLTSWGTGCARATHPGVNVRLSRYGAWINQNA